MSVKEQSFISVASYNVLCDAYIRPEFYPLCDPAAFRPDRRHPLLLDRVAGLGTDIICLQEVDAEMYEQLRRRLASEGYVGRGAQKMNGKPDGCATFVRDKFTIHGWVTRVFMDRLANRSPSGHVALETMLTTEEGHLVVIANTHFKWDPPETPPEARYGIAQATELMKGRDQNINSIVCGDFNAEHGSDTMNVFARAGHHNAHAWTMAPTCVANGKARKIDAILCSKSMLVHDFSTPPIGDATPLPSATEPSDHVPIVATLVTDGY